MRLMGGTIRACSRYGLGTIFQFDVQLKMPGPKDRASLSPSSRAKEIRRNLEGLKVSRLWGIQLGNRDHPLVAVRVWKGELFISAAPHEMDMHRK